MAVREERRSYVILTHDGLVLHTKPITREEAEWLLNYAYKDVKNRSLRARYLAEWGNVLDASVCVDQLKILHAGLYFNVLGVYEGPDEFTKRLNQPLRRWHLSPEDRRIIKQIFRELLGKVRDFLREPVEPRPIGPLPVRYYEMPYMHVTYNRSSGREDVVPRPEWYAYNYVICCVDYYGISVFPDSLWLWRQSRWYVQAVVVRRDASDGDVVAALANDAAVQGFLKQHKEFFKELLRETEAELIDKGYGDVARKVKVMLAAYELLTAGRHEEEALPA